MLKKHQTEGTQNVGAFKTTFSENIYKQFEIEMKCVEPCTQSVIEELENSGYRIMCLTARTPEFLSKTLTQLESSGIIFHNKTFPQQCHFNNLEYPCMYKNGIFGVNENNKGTALFLLLDANKFYPKTIVFIDDREKYLKQIEEIAKKKGINFVGLRYSCCDNRESIFDQNAADKDYEKLISQENQTYNQKQP
jgi:hydroxymethylpyrimidine pyrophosphatase-like HAD family hydrolase